MKLVLGAFLVITLFVIGHYIFKVHARIEESKLGHTVAWLLKIGFIIVLFNLINLFIPAKLPSLIAYSVYFISTN